MKECNLDKFEIIFTKTPEEFYEMIQNNDSELIINIFCALKDENITKIIELIKEDELKGNGNILENILQLEPLTLKIIDAFIESDFLESAKFITRVDKIRQINSNILQHLKEQKKKIRRDYKAGINTFEEELKNVEKELEKHKNILNNLQKAKEKEKELVKIKAQIKKIKEELKVDNIKKLENKLEQYKIMYEEIKNIQKEIEKSKEIFKNLPKDEA